MTIEEFKERVFPLKNRLYRFAKRIIGNGDDAEDAVQEAMIRLWNNRSKLDPEKGVESLAMVITKNLCIDMIRKKSRFTYIDDGDEFEAPAQLPDYQSEMSDSTRIIHQLVSQLPDKQRMVLHLRDIEDLSYEEISDIMKTNPNAVKTCLCRARKAIRNKLEEIYQYERV